MADHLAGYIPAYIEDETEREPIVKLAKMITERVPQKLGLKKITKYDPEYWELAAMCTDEMAEIALKMGVRKPKTLEQMVKITGMERECLEELLEQMAWNGVLEYNWENPRYEKQYILPMFVPGSAEFSNMNAQMLNEHPEVGRFFERMSRLPLEKITPMVPPGGAGIGMHVIPVEKAIEMENESISLEHISYWLDKYGGKYAASPCSCRYSRQGLRAFGTQDLDLVVLENVGNLVCPAEFDTGAVKNAMILSVPEGHDKSLKYPLMFQVCDVLLISKVDVLPYFDFDMEKVTEYAHMRNPDLKIFPVSAKTGEGIDAWCEWLRGEVAAWKCI